MKWNAPKSAGITCTFHYRVGHVRRTEVGHESGAARLHIYTHGLPGHHAGHSCLSVLAENVALLRSMVGCGRPSAAGVGATQVFGWARGVYTSRQITCVMGIYQQR